jgi:colanic acid/amylovoran biosynthesis glycosyltransferase
VRVAWIVSRFPHVSETFIVRELNAVAARGELEIELMSLFPSVDPLVHPSARRWVDRLRRPGPAAAVLALAWWMLRRPGRTAGVVVDTVRDHRRRPGLMLRALATLAIAARHAVTVERLGLRHVHAHYATYPALAAWMCGRLTGVSYSFTAHAHDIFVDQSMLDRKVREAAFVVAISDFNRRFLHDHADAATPIHVVHCGIDPAAFPWSPRDTPAAPARILCVASLQEYKGHEVLLAALAGARDGLGAVRVDLVGDGELRGALEQRCRELGLADVVRFHGSLDEPAVARLLADSDVFVLPSTVARDGQMEGIPVVLMEALAAGLCVVASRLSGIPELVRDGETGFLVEPGDPEDLAAGLARALGDGCAGLDREAGRRLVESEFSVERSAEQLSELVLAQGPGAARP